MTDNQVESFEELFKEEKTHKIKRLTPGQKIKATIVGINNESAFLDVGSKSEGVINSAELKDEQGNYRHNVGDVIDVYFLRSKPSEQLFTTSLGGGASHGHLADAYAAGIPVDGFVKAEIKGGFEITLPGNVRAFCPYSQMGLRRVEDAAKEYLETHLKFRITRFEENGRNIVVSARALQEEARQELKESLKATLSEGQTVEGVISSLRDFGAFVDIGGIEGLIPLSEIGWSRVDKVDEYFSVGQTVKAVVKKLDWEGDKISLSYKETLDNPWVVGIKEFPPDSTHIGKVAKLMNFGAFISLAPGLDGLIHISKLGSGRRINHPREVLEVGQDIEVKIESIDENEKRISLVPSDYVSPESKDEQDRHEFKTFLAENKKSKKSDDVGSLGALLKAKLAEKRK